MNLQLRIGNYITRYAPSEKKLREYISRKNHTFNISELFGSNGYSESIMCDIWIRTFVAGARGEKEIRQKLIKKGFPSPLIEEKLSNFISEIHDWDIHSTLIESKINSLLKKGKSKQIILLTLSQKYPYFTDEISDYLESRDDSDGMKTEIHRYLGKYDISDFTERSKFFAALQRKGFEYKKIKNALEELQEI